MIKIFCDTNFLLDILIKNRPDSTYSLLIMELVKQRKASIVVNALSLIDSYYIASKLGVCNDDMNNLSAWLLNYAAVLPIGFSEYYDATQISPKDLYSALYVAQAHNNCCDVFITSDSTLLREGSSGVISYMSSRQFYQNNLSKHDDII